MQSKRPDRVGIDELAKIFRGSDRPLSIPDAGIPSGLRILMLAPHPDDFDAIGVTLKFFHNADSHIHVAVARTGSGVDEDYLPGSSLAEKADMREREQRSSIGFFGLPHECLEFLDFLNDEEGQVAETLENAPAIRDALVGTEPDMVFMPHGNDSNGAHRAVYRLCRREAPATGRPIALFLNRDPKTIEMRTDFYMPFGKEEAEWKARLLRFHDTQHQRNLRSRGNGLDERLLDVAAGVASSLSLAADFAEAFEVELVNAD